MSTAVNRFSHVKPADTPWRGDGLRDSTLDNRPADSQSVRLLRQLMAGSALPLGCNWGRNTLWVPQQSGRQTLPNQGIALFLSQNRQSNNPSATGAALLSDQYGRYVQETRQQSVPKQRVAW